MTQAAPPPSDVVIRKAIATTIRSALTSLYTNPLGNEIVIHDHWLWGFALGENASLLRVASGTEMGKIHGWIIGLSGISRVRPSQQVNNQGAYVLRKTNPNRRDILRSYRVWCYHELDTGTAGQESDYNSENRLAVEIETVADAFSMSPSLGIDNEWFMGHEELQFSPIDVYKFGEAQANVAQGTLSVRLKRPLDLNQY